MKIRKFVNFNGNISFELITDPIKIVSKDIRRKKNNFVTQI